MDNFICCARMFFFYILGKGRKKRSVPEIASNNDNELKLVWNTTAPRCVGMYMLCINRQSKVPVSLR